MSFTESPKERSLRPEEDMLRDGQSVRLNGQVIGKVTSGCYAPSLGCSVAMARVAADKFQSVQDNVSPDLSIDCNKRSLKVQLTRLPFLSNLKK